MGLLRRSLRSLLAMTGVGAMMGIVILGILASVAIPRLAGTKADAEISAAVANLRTLISDLNTYYVARGGFDLNTGGTAITTTWDKVTNVPVDTPTKQLGTNTSLRVGGVNCIDFLVTKETDAAPAYIKFAKASTGVTAGSVCAQVQNSPSLAHYFTSKVPGHTGEANKGYISIGSNTKLVR